MTQNDGSVISVDEAGLAAYGIVIVQDDVNPLLEIYTEDTQWITTSFDLQISSTVVEETTWSNYAVIIINYSNPAVPAASTLETQPEMPEAGIEFPITLQSRDVAGNILYDDFIIQD